MAGRFLLPRHTVVALCALVLALVAPAAQTKGQSPPDPTKPAAAADPYGRTTPRGTITGLGQAVNRQDASAVRYLQLTAAQRPQAEQLARDLSGLIERYFLAPLTTLSDVPEGATTDGLPLDRERIVLTIGRTTLMPDAPWG